MTKYIIEGADGVGKTEVVRRLNAENIYCQDRCKKVISKYMVFDISIYDRVHIYYSKCLNKDCKVIFLINNDEIELLKRIHNRKIIDEYDLMTNEFNRLYLETYKYIKTLDVLKDMFYIIDVTNLSIEEQTNKVKNLILKG